MGLHAALSGTWVFTTRSPTRFKWFGAELTLKKRSMISQGFGHAFITLKPNSTAVYVISEVYSPNNESGIRFDDPALRIEWPIEPSVVSDKDLAWRPLGTRMEEINDGFASFSS